ncbi:MAG: hypothetical protein LBQ79_03355 [Deltaproteobacteria bacterium]|jgi:hypothetical protein|nr:hypothetical protein [Deltaproteobacteria bacterium]
MPFKLLFAVLCLTAAVAFSQLATAQTAPPGEPGTGVASDPADPEAEPGTGTASDPAEPAAEPGSRGASDPEGNPGIL